MVDPNDLFQRITQLRAEYEAGEQQLAALEAREADLKKTMLRISGAIQVLEELLQSSPGSAA